MINVVSEECETAKSDWAGIFARRGSQLQTASACKSTRLRAPCASIALIMHQYKKRLQV